MDQKTRSTHMHIIGASGEGKSKFMEHLIRQDIINNRGLCLIDPHGYLYNDIVRWCATRNMLDRASPKKIVLFDPSEDRWTFGFNPLQGDSSNISFHVDTMVKAVAKVWGGEDTDKTPRLKRCLRILFHALAEKNLSLLEAGYIVSPANQTLRKYLTGDIQDDVIRQQWDYFNTLKEKPFYDEFSSTINRMMEFLAAPSIRAIIGQIEQTINFRKIMDEGWILLVNMASANKISDDNARLLGTLIVNDLFMKAKGRPKGSRPFYLYIDECGLFINEDIGRILDEGRKFGLHLILAHQHLSQLKRAGEDIYRSVMMDARTKVVFGGSDPEEAEILARQIFLGELSLEEPKEILDKPTVVGYIKAWLNNYSSSISHSVGEGQSVAYGRSASQTEGEATNEEGHIVATVGTSKGSSDSETKVSSFSNTRGESWGKSEALIPELEDRPTQVYSLEEQIYKAMVLMVNQPTQHAIIKLPQNHTQIVKTTTIKEGYANKERVRKFKEECYKLTDFAKPKLIIEEELKNRRLLLEGKANRALETKYPTNFKE